MQSFAAKVCMVAILLVTWFSQPSTAASVSVTATSNLYKAAGNASLFDGGLPTDVFIPTGSTQLTFSNVTGSVSYGGDPNGPDGSPPHPDSMPPQGGLSGINGGRIFYLSGVFTTNAVPTPPPPATLDFTGNENFTSLSPLLEQVFFVGDGLTGTGTGLTQIFHIPAGATHLYLGFVDNLYNDNSGILSADVNFNAVPEPATWTLLGLGTLGVLGLARNFRRIGRGER